ncbi:MAG: hypothetical protein Kow0042_13170 [Calditrichia bacterium]
MVPVDFYKYRIELRRVLLTQMQSLADVWDPFIAAWTCYAVSADGIENNLLLAELCERMRRWIEEENIWAVQRNIGAIGLTLWLCEELHCDLKAEIAAQLSERIQQLNADETWSPLRDPEQVFLLALGFKRIENEPTKEHLKNISLQEIRRGPLRRRILYAAALRELGEHIDCPHIDAQDEGDIIALVWWAERYDENKHEQWERFSSIQDRIALAAENASDTQRILSTPEIAMLYEAIVKETMYPDPNLLFKYFPLHKRIREITQDHFMNGKYVSAVFEATKALNDKIQERSGIFNKNEAELVQATMKQIRNPSSLKIIFNKFLHEDSGKNEQAGIALICEGVFKAFRNPKGHKTEDHELVQLTPYEAIEQLIVIDYLIKRIEEADTASE